MTSATFRHPSLLAVSVAQVDQMSGGRVELGLDAGWWAREHAAIGIELPEIRERFKQFAQQLEILHGLWSTPVGETYSFSSDLYRLDRAAGLPKPAQGHVPIIIGGDGKTHTPELPTRVDRLYMEILDLADLEHLDYFADALGL